MTPEDIAQITAIVAAPEERLNARIGQVETSLRTEFHKWASPTEARARSHAAALRAIDAEMDSSPIV